MDSFLKSKKLLETKFTKITPYKDLNIILDAELDKINRDMLTLIAEHEHRVPFALYNGSNPATVLYDLKIDHKIRDSYLSEMVFGIGELFLEMSKPNKTSFVSIDDVSRTQNDNYLINNAVTLSEIFMKRDLAKLRKKASKVNYDIKEQFLISRPSEKNALLKVEMKYFLKYK
ncbi:MAG: hypothetical protein ABIC91_02415 [Nanoarchaeota archaeon]|nr:hypothetical protein [Nanoarchaeota archaeon]MBU1030108.1 hypothetical protein [Nanoarchaeota archaeon]MBU1849991.1 hypothetical protein [Nanoarchaeota archaeon]